MRRTATPGRSAYCSSCSLRVWHGWRCRGRGRWRGRIWSRQIERGHKVAHFLTRRDVAQRERRPAAAPLEIEQGEAVQEQFLVDHAFAQARGRAKADTPGQCLDYHTH